MKDSILKSMPKLLMGRELDEKLCIFPDYIESIRQKTAAERLIALQDIYRVFIPNQMSREIYSKLYLSLLHSLEKKESLLAIRQFNENTKVIRQNTYESILGGSDSFTIIGPSGIGKTSAVSRAINILTEQPIIEVAHTHIISCLQVQTPADCSIKGLLLEILRKADELLQSNYYKNAMRAHATIDMLIGSVSQVALNHIGLLVVDEIQNVVYNKNGRTIIGTLTQLINNSGISICMVGTPECALFFEKEMILARRSLGLNYSAMEYSEEFCGLCKALLQFCYVQNAPCVDESLLIWLYNHSAGNVSIVVGLLHDAQEIAILEETEKLDIAVLHTAYERRLTMLHDYISTNTVKITATKKTTKKAIAPKTTEIKKEPSIKTSISEISANAKHLQHDTISELRRNGIRILEVII